MKNITQIRDKIKELQDRLEDAQTNENYAAVPNFATFRVINTQINALAWVLDEQRKTLE